ncbi:MAG: transposase [Gemmatimonadaceae bacterium]
MARLPRLVVPGVPLHITQRGNDRVRTFHDERDLRHYHDLLVEVTSELGCAVHAYVLMPNHVHLLVTPPDTSAPARMMQRLGARYVRYINTVHGRTGTLWEGRFRSSLVDSDRYVLSCMRYIELNPVRAGLESDPALARWSSYRFNALGEPDTLLSPHPLYLALGASPRQARDAYATSCQEALGPDVLRDIRRAIRCRNNRADARAGTEFEWAHEVERRLQL